MITPKPQKLSAILNSMYDVSNVRTSYDYWFSRLLSITLEMFEWDNLPDDATFTGRELELQLQLAGYAYIFMKKGKINTVHTTLYDFDVNYNPTRYVYANPVIGSNNGQIDTAIGAVVYNNILQSQIVGLPIDGSLRSFLCHYARQLADISSSINIYAVNNRITDYPVAKNDSMVKALQNFFNKRRMGEHEVIWQNDEIIDAFASVNRGNRPGTDSLKDLIDAEDRMLEKFYRSIGIKFRQNKQAQLNVEEVESDEQLLLISPDNMLKCRQEGIEKINDKLGTSISVKLNPKYDRSLMKEGDNNGTSGNINSDNDSRLSDSSMRISGSLPADNDKRAD